ncbi:MAG: type II toxin-antitoxin system HicB family antitoxin [Candidatus Hydrogenedentota bacterium]
MQKHLYPVLIRPGETGKLIAECPLLEGCLSQGENVKEALENIREAVELCIEVMLERGETPPETANTLLSQVAVDV